MQMEKWGFKLTLLGFFLMGMAQTTTAQKMDICKIYGAVYVTKDAREADFVIYVEDSEAFADLVVFRGYTELYADDNGLWFVTKASNFAKFVVLITGKEVLAVFSVYYTETPAFAGCKQ